MRSETIAVIVLLLAFSAGAAWWYGNGKDAATVCSGDATVQYYCFSDQARGIAERQGITAALDFVNRVVRPQSTFGITHMVMHEVGYAAYEELRDAKRAMELLPADALTDRAYFYFEGYQHGVFQKFFADEKTTAPAQLIREVCGEFLVEDDSEGQSSVRGEQCFHAVGHALMYANGNKVDGALRECEALPAPWMSQWCYFGVFMENFYLYLPYYHSHAEKPETISPSMTGLCRAVRDDQKSQCARFVARSYLARNPGAFKEAFRECRDLEERYRSECVSYAAVRFIPSAFKGDFARMIKACSEAGPSYEEACLGAVAIGIKEGESGIAYKDYPFCDRVLDKFRTTCRQAVEQRYVKIFEE